MIREPYDAIVYYATALSHASLPGDMVHIHGRVYADKTGKHADGEQVSLICDPRSALVGHWMGRPVYKTTTGIKILFNENPPAMKDKGMSYDAILNDWAKVGDNETGYLVGEISGDIKGRFADGTGITTSRVLPSQTLKEGAIVTTASGTNYKLGRPYVKSDPKPETQWNGHAAGPDEVIRKAQGKIYVHLKRGHLYRVAGYGFDSERERWMLRYVRCNAASEIAYFHLPEDFFREGRFLEVKE